MFLGGHKPKGNDFNEAGSPGTHRLKSHLKET